MIEMSADTVELFKALVAFQAECPSPTKSSVNPHFKNRYAALDTVLDTVKPFLAKHGLSLVQFPCGTTPGMVGVVTQINHVSGQWMRCAFSVNITKNDPQMAGSGISYARRYAVLAALNLAAEDDDGESATRDKPQAKQSTTDRLNAIASGGERAERPLAGRGPVGGQAPQTATVATGVKRGGDPVPVAKVIESVGAQTSEAETPELARVRELADEAGLTVERIMTAPVRPKGDEPTLTFGKYKGRLVLDESIPAGYYRWYAQQTDFERSPVKDWITYAIQQHEWERGDAQ